MRISDWSSDVCSSDLVGRASPPVGSRSGPAAEEGRRGRGEGWRRRRNGARDAGQDHQPADPRRILMGRARIIPANPSAIFLPFQSRWVEDNKRLKMARKGRQLRSEEHTSELQSLIRISYAVFCFK